MVIIKKSWFLALCVALLAVIMAGCSSGPNTEKTPQYPTRPVEILVPATAGGGTDVNARVIAEFLSKKWGQPVTIVNKAGKLAEPAGHDLFYNSKPDGYYIYAETHSASSMQRAFMRERSNLKLEDRAYIARTIKESICYAVKADAPWKNFRELTDWVKANPDKLVWTTAAHAGSLSSFGINQWLSSAGIDGKKTRMMVGGGAADAINKLLGGHVNLICQNVSEVLPMQQAGKIRVLAVVADERDKRMPDVPTAKEAGFPDLNVCWWTGFTGPKGLPDDVVKRWADTIVEVMNDPEFKKKAAEMNLSLGYLGPEDFKKYVFDEAERYSSLADKIGLRMTQESK